MLVSCLLRVLPASCAITLENRDLRLVLGEDGRAVSLIEKSSRQECLTPGTNTPAFVLILDLASKRTAYAASHVRREGERLVVDFEAAAATADIRIKNTDNYINFTLEKINRQGAEPDFEPVAEMRFLQLPVRQRQNFGDWLNVMWDNQVAINVLATDPYTKIDSDSRAGYRILWAGASSDVKTDGVGAALIVTRTPGFLDRMAHVESDFGLPSGAKSRQRPEYKWSYLGVGYYGNNESVTVGDIDRYIAYAKQAGLRAIQLYYPTFAKGAGHFEWRPEYANGMADLNAIVAKIRAAGLLPGLHIHYNKATKDDGYVDPYIAPVPDPRLHLQQIFTLATPVDDQSTVIRVYENPLGTTMTKERRYLKVEDELITYDAYTTTPPYEFIGCRRGALRTKPRTHHSGLKFGVLDVDTWPIFVRFDQRTDIQEEVAQRLASIFNDPGFRFAYFDGAEDTQSPFWFNTSWAQWQVYRLIRPEPMFAEAAVNSHFSWHMASRSNGYDPVSTEEVKEYARLHPFTDAQRLTREFTSNEFGWLRFYLPSGESSGTQADIIEFVDSLAAAWNCPISLMARVDQLDSHPRTPDILEVVRRWEQMRDRLAPAQRESLRDVKQEHTLVLNERNELELIPYELIPHVASAERSIRAFVFERAGKIYVVYWHTSGEGMLEVALPRKHVRLLEDLRRELPFEGDVNRVRLPVDGKKYLECTGLNRAAIVAAFQRATLLGK